MAKIKQITEETLRAVRELAANPENRLNVIGRNGKWVLKRSGAKRAMGIYATKDDAVNTATQKVREGKVIYALVFDKYGNVEKKIS